MTRRAGAGSWLPAAFLGLALLPAGCTGSGDGPGEAHLLPLDASVRITGHRELVVHEDGSLTPIFIGRSPPVLLCFDTQSDTTSWIVRWSLASEEQRPSQVMPAGRRLGEVACFEGPLPERHDPEQPLTLCWQVEDTYHGQTFRRQCRSIWFRGEDPVFTDLLSRGGALSHGRDLGAREQARRIGALEHEARAKGYPNFALQLRLIEVDKLRQSGEMEEARRLVDDLPPWLERAEAANTGSLAKVARAKVYIDSGWQIAKAWSELQEASALMRTIVSKWRYTVAMREAEILGQIGALQEARKRLEEALKHCGPEAPCSELDLLGARSQLYWYVAQEPDVDPEALQQAIEGMESLLQDPPPNTSPTDLVNERINLAYYRVLRGEEVSESLAEARALLATVARPGEDATSETAWLSAWIDLVEGLGALNLGNAQLALARCSSLMEVEQFPRIEAWAASCAGRAYRRLGKAAAALTAFERAVTLHQLASPRQLAQQIDLGPGQRAEDSYRAAQAAVELDQPVRAWALLEQLDESSTDEQLRSLCRERALDPESRTLWEGRDRQRQELLWRLFEVQRPVGDEQAARNQVTRTQLMQELQQLYRDLPGCEDLMAAGPAGRVPSTGWRIVALEDEILLLHRSASGEVRSTRRAADRRKLRRIIRQVEEALTERRMSDEDWRVLVQPLAEALIPPRPESLAPVTRFALHGFLQDAPMAALPLTREPGRRWLADVTTPALQPAIGLSPRPVNSAAPARNGLFVVDPESNLPSGPELARLYQEAFPDADHLRGAEATVDNLRAHLGTAAFLHLDAHAQFNRFFPELSSIELADGAIDLPTLAELPAPPLFANLSACETGRWPTTADAGRFGIAGAFARRGTAWVIASRAVIDDGLTRDFNQSFYRDLSARRLEAAAVPRSYSEALAQLRARYLAAEWANLFLLVGRENQGPGGQRSAVITPDRSEAVPLAREQRTNPTVYARTAESFDGTY